MVATTIPFRDGALASHNRRMDTDTSGNLAAVNLEAPEQRAALIAALQLLGADATLVAIRDKLIAAPATAAGQEAMRALLAGTLAVSAQTLPLPAGAATGAKQDTGNTSLTAIVTALATTLKTATTDSTGAPQLGPSGIAPIVGTFTAVAPNQYATGIVASTGISAALPASVGRGVWAMIEANSADGSAPGTVTGSYVVQKSTNGGGKWRPLTVGGGAWATFSAYAYEPISSEDDAGSLYRIVCVTAPASGTITYRLGHS